MYQTRMNGEPSKKEMVFVKPSWEEKIALCHEWKKSGISRSEFCKKNGIALATFFGWCNRAWPDKHKESVSRLTPVKIVQHQETEKDNGDVMLELSLPNHVQAHISLPMASAMNLIRRLCDATTTLR